MYGSILMTRIPGQILNDCHKSLEPSQLASIMSDIDSCLAVMRRYSSPWGSRICSVLGGRVHGARIVGGRNGPYPNSLAFNHDYIQYKQSQRWVHEPVEEVLGDAEVMNTLSANHRVVFTHGDLLPHNILIRDGRLAAILDWEFSGWFPEYWEYTEMQRFSPKYFWTQQVVALPSYKYAAELKASRAMWTLASDSFNFW
ncbi:unnamed protein product [Somion occarium]|uniref:Aminoglycoside phosphotransferase domain-containing protein n=1 Tax=Somion occarium TaxID=3059160 RepID=A0ABP1DGT3_9APHY